LSLIPPSQRKAATTRTTTGRTTATSKPYKTIHVEAEEGDEGAVQNPYAVGRYYIPVDLDKENYQLLVNEAKRAFKDKENQRKANKISPSAKDEDLVKAYLEYIDPDIVFASRKARKEKEMQNNFESVTYDNKSTISPMMFTENKQPRPPLLPNVKPTPPPIKATQLHGDEYDKYAQEAAIKDINAMIKRPAFDIAKGSLKDEPFLNAHPEYRRKKDEDYNMYLKRVEDAQVGIAENYIKFLAESHGLTLVEKKKEEKVTNKEVAETIPAAEQPESSVTDEGNRKERVKEKFKEHNVSAKNQQTEKKMSAKQKIEAKQRADEIAALTRIIN